MVHLLFRSAEEITLQLAIDKWIPKCMEIATERWHYRLLQLSIFWDR